MTKQTEAPERSALKLALEALEICADCRPLGHETLTEARERKITYAITAIREALAEKSSGTEQPAQRKPLTEQMVVAAARMLSDRQAAACNVDCGDMWKIHGNDFLDDARAALEAAHGIKENT